MQAIGMMVSNQGKVLVTGATGFVGSLLVSRLLQSGREVVAVSRKQDRALDKRSPNLEWVSWEQINPIMLADVSAIIHLATCYGRSEPPADVYRANVVAPLELAYAGATAGVRVFVNTGSYFAKAGENYPYLPDYRASKRLFSEALQRLGQTTPGLRVVEMQLEHPYGPDDPADRFCAQVFDAFIQAKATLECTAGEQVRDFIHVDDVVEAYLVVLEQTGLLDAWQRFEVGTGEAHTLRSFIESVQRLSGRATQPNFGALAYRPHEIMSSVANNASLRSLGWQPRYPMMQGIAHVLRHRSKGEVLPTDIADAAELHRLPQHQQ
jgi:nucleoside-diphosphate-sugar epimerase